MFLSIRIWCLYGISHRIDVVVPLDMSRAQLADERLFLSLLRIELS